MHPFPFLDSHSEGMRKHGEVSTYCMRLSIVAIVVGSLKVEGTTDRVVHEWSTHQNMGKTNRQEPSQAFDSKGARGRNRTDTR